MRSKQKGIALILVMILLFVLAVMAVSMTFLSQTETWSSMNYRMMTQARYGAEAGLESAVNFLVPGTGSYTAPTTSGTDRLSNYTVVNWSASSPVSVDGDIVGVTYNGNPVVLSSTSSQANYPVSSVETAFQNATSGSFQAGNLTITYSAHAVLLSMNAVQALGSSTTTGVQTWRITGDAVVANAPNARVEVSTIMETQVFPTFTYAAFATSSGCGALQFGGSSGTRTGSYDDTILHGGVPTTNNYDGNVGTNGNLDESGANAYIYGTLSSAQPGSTTSPPSSCSSGDVTAYIGASGHVTGGLVPLPQQVQYPPANMNTSGALHTVQSFSSNTVLAPNTNYGDIQCTGHCTLHVSAGVYTMNSFSESGANTQLVVDSGPVIFNIAGVNDGNLPASGSTCPAPCVVLLAGNSLQNAAWKPDNFLIQYNGTGSVQLAGGTDACGLLYAPSANFSFAGGSTWYGAVIGNQLVDMGGTGLYYDRRLANNGEVISSPTLSSFTWKKY